MNHTVVKKTKSFDPFVKTNDFVSEKMLSKIPGCREFATEVSSILDVELQVFYKGQRNKVVKSQIQNQVF